MTSAVRFESILKPSGAFMRPLIVLVSLASIAGTSTVYAETRVFIIPAQDNGDAIEHCLARGENCGAPVHRFCQSQQFAQASSARKVDPADITGSVPKTGTNCSHGPCGEYVAIICQR